MRIFFYFFCSLLLLTMAGSCSRKVTAIAPPAVLPPLPDLPPSLINIPLQIHLNSLYALAEKSVDTVFTSPGYPGQWIESDCATRYQYRFRRTPLRFAASGTSLQLSFTGLYQIIGSTRACVGGTVLSPWTPACRCGFTEGERRVDIGFGATFNLLPNHLLQTKITRLEPKPLDACNVCFWGQDITSVVMKGLKAELDLSKKAMEDSFGTINLRPYLQLAWDRLSQVYSLPELGYLSLGPTQLHMEKINAQNNLLSLNLGITATPRLSFTRPEQPSQPVPAISPAPGQQGFSIYLEASMPYDSLSRVVNGYLAGKRFDINDGLVKKYIIVKACKLYSNLYGKMVVELDFEGSHKGTVYFTGKPVYNDADKKIEIQDFGYDLKTNDFLLRTARWLFDKRIVSEIRKYTTVDLAGYYDTATTTLNSWLNREWMPGIRGSGNVTALKLTELYALPQYLLVRSNCSGAMQVVVTDLHF